MKRRVLKALLVTAAAALVAAPQQARAEGYVTPWVGANWGSDISNGRAAFGVTAGGMGGGIFGGEVNFGYSPSFFGTQNDFGHNTVIDLMGNVIVGIPIGGNYHTAAVKPFVTAGVGLLRTQIDGGTLATVSSSNNEWGWNAGGGVMGYFNEHVGLRGDIRYIRGFENLATGNTVVDLNGSNQLHFWRISGGVVLR
ncbi:MAG TPA: outer membrane beta-barrel protein [Vicinamibacterales bacterium]